MFLLWTRMRKLTEIMQQGTDKTLGLWVYNNQILCPSSLLRKLVPQFRISRRKIQLLSLKTLVWHSSILWGGGKAFFTLFDYCGDSVDRIKKNLECNPKIHHWIPPCPLIRLCPLLALKFCPSVVNREDGEEEVYSTWVSLWDWTSIFWLIHRLVWFVIAISTNLSLKKTKIIKRYF